MHGDQNIPTESETSQKGFSTTNQDGTQKGIEAREMMDNFSKTLLSICGVQTVALIIMALFAWSFVSKLPEEISENHDAILTGKVMLEVQGSLMSDNAKNNQIMSVDMKAMEKAITILSGEVKALTTDLKTSNKQINDKLDYAVEAWRDDRNSGNPMYE